MGQLADLVDLWDLYINNKLSKKHKLRMKKVMDEIEKLSIEILR